MTLNDVLRIVRRRWRVVFACLAARAGRSGGGHVPDAAGVLVGRDAVRVARGARGQFRCRLPGEPDREGTGGLLRPAAAGRAHHPARHRPPAAAHDRGSARPAHHGDGAARHGRALRRGHGHVPGPGGGDRERAGRGVRRPRAAARAAVRAGDRRPDYCSGARRRARPATTAPAPAPSPAPKIGAQIIRPATAVPVPVSPSVPFNLALGAAIGLLVGLAGAFVRDARDTTIRSAAQLRAVTGAPVLAQIATDRGARLHPLTAGAAPPPRPSRPSASCARTCSSSDRTGPTGSSRWRAPRRARARRRRRATWRSPWRMRPTASCSSTSTSAARRWSSTWAWSPAPGRPASWRDGYRRSAPCAGGRRAASTS